MEMPSRNSGLPEVVVVFTTYTSHRLLEAGQLVLEVFYRVVKDVQLGGLHSDHFSKLIGLENGT